MPAGSKSVPVDKYTISHNFGSLAINTILCYYHGASVGMIGFYPKGQAPVSVLLGTGVFTIFLEIEKYLDIIETFRYEKPIYVQFSWDDKNYIKNGSLSTQLEPIGEQEGSGVPPTT